MKQPLALNVYLMQKGVDPFREIDFSGFQRVTDVSIGRGLQSPLLAKTTGAEPEWLASLRQISGDPFPERLSSAVQALILLRWKRRWFVCTFGHAWQRIAVTRIEPDFGIRCVLNLASPDALVSIRRDRISDASIQAIEQIPDTDDIHRFGMDIEQDMLRGVRAKIDKSLRFGALIVGGDAFKATIDLENESLLSFCRRALRCYGMKNIAKNFAWFDQIKAVNDEVVIGALDSRLARAISIGVRSITLSIPEFLAWDEYDFFSFTKPRRRQAPVSEPFEPRQWRVAHGAQRVSVAEINAAFVYAYKQGQNHLVSKWPLRKCLNATVKFSGAVYITQAGKWYRVNKNFVSQIQTEVAGLPVDSKRFPAVRRSEQEGAYNRRIAGAFGSRYFCLDRKLVQVVGRSTIEMCDILRFDGAFVCVKPWGGKSQHLSHLFQQALVAGQLTASHAPFVAGVRAAISKPAFQLIWDREATKVSGAVFVLAALRGVAKERLPFFAQVALVMCARNLKQMRYDVRYAAILAQRS